MISEVTNPGIYRHYKGGLYRVLFTAIMSTNDCAGKLCVVYVSLTRGTIHVRDEKEFNGLVPGFSTYRFMRIGDSIHEDS